MQLTDLDLSIVRNQMLKLSHRQIAEFLGVDVSVISAAVNELTEGTEILTKQMRLDALRKSSRVKPAAPSKVKLRKVDEEQKKKEARQLEKQKNTAERSRIEAERARKRAEGRGQYATRQIDFTKLVTVRIDRTTSIYAKPGEEEKAKAIFLKTYQRPIDRI